MNYNKHGDLAGESPLSQGLSPLENSPQDCFQFTPFPSSSKARAAARRKSFAPLRKRNEVPSATKGLLALWKPRQRGAALDPPVRGAESFDF